MVLEQPETLWASSVCVRAFASCRVVEHLPVPIVVKEQPEPTGGDYGGSVKHAHSGHTHVHVHVI